MAIAIVGSPGSTQQSGGASFTVAWPSGIQSGDIAILAVYGNTDGWWTSNSTTFTQIGTQVSSAGVYGLYMFWRRCTGSESGNLTVNTNSSGVQYLGLLSVYRGCIASGTPYENFTQGTVSSSSSVTPPALTTSGTGELGVVISATRSSNKKATQGTWNLDGFASVDQTNWYQQSDIWTLQIPTATTTSISAISYGSSSSVSASSFALLPAAAVTIVPAPIQAPGPGVQPNAQYQFTGQTVATTTQIVGYTTGVSATSGIGSVTPALAVALTGVIGTGSVGSVVTGAPQPITGVSATGSVGTLLPSTAVNITQTVSVGAAGTVVTSGGVFTGATFGMVPQPGPGTAAPFNLNQFLWDPRTTDLPPSTSGTAALTGVTGTGSVGNVGSLGGGGANPTGVTGTGGTGTAGVTFLVPISGTAGTGTVGIWTPGNTIELQGITGTGGTGSVTPNIGGSLAGLSGVSATGSVGNVTGSISNVMINPTYIEWTDPTGIPLADISGFQVGIRETTHKGYYTVLPPMAFATARQQLIPPLRPGVYAAAVMTFTYSQGPTQWSSPETVFTMTEPAGPASVSVDATGLVSWDAVDGAIAYQVGIRGSSDGIAGDVYPIMPPQTTGLSMQFPVYLAPADYALAVYAVLSGFETDWSSEAAFTVVSQTPPVFVTTT